MKQREAIVALGVLCLAACSTIAIDLASGALQP
jgi:hypothetical protein